MNNKYKPKFELINNSLWLLLKGYVKDDEAYKKIMSEEFKIFMAWDERPDKFSDEWWHGAIEENFFVYPDKYKGTEFKDFAGFLAIGFSDFWELEKKGRNTNLDFYKCVSKAFIYEWERLRDAEETKKKTT